MARCDDGKLDQLSAGPPKNRLQERLERCHRLVGCGGDGGREKERQIEALAAVVEDAQTPVLGAVKLAASYG